MGQCGTCNSPIPNTAENELLPSQIENFTKQFFGTVQKTEVNGVVEWILPCDLDIGLENNARQNGEGLACYFLRLFREGIVGLTGPQGDPGPAGTNGYNAFSIVLAGFTQPTLESPLVQVRTAYNPALIPGLNVFIQGSGWYIINSGDQEGYLQLALTKEVSGVSGTIPAGRLVIPAGYPGQSVTGPQGPIGLQGPKGDPGETFTVENGVYETNVGNDYALQVTYTALNFTTSTAQLLLPTRGRYLLNAVIQIEGETGVNLNDLVAIKIRNTSIGGEVGGSEQKLSYLSDGQRAQIVISTIYQTDADNQTVTLFGQCTTSDVVSVIGNHTVFNYARLS
jgi:hypothetical protein